jgi:exodeoxyribonuclease X
MDALWLASESARSPSVMPFGKHKGMAMADVPADYKRWLLGQGDIDPYLRKALEAH